MGREVVGEPLPPLDVCNQMDTRNVARSCNITHPRSPYPTRTRHPPNHLAPYVN